MTQLSTILGLDVSDFGYTQLESSIGLDMYHRTNSTHVTLGFTVTDADVDWIGFGISEMGHMKGSDIVSMEFSQVGDVTTLQVHDRHVEFAPITVSETGTRSYDSLYPSKDVSSDWVIERSAAANGIQGAENGVDGCVISSAESVKRAVLISRKLDTTDIQDRAIGENDVPIIWAWGSDSFQFHGANRGFETSFNFKKASKQGNEYLKFSPADVAYDGYMEYTVNFNIPEAETKYYEPLWDISGENSSVFASAFHIVGYELLDTHPFVHHLVVYDNTAQQVISVFTKASAQMFPQCGFPAGNGKLNSIKLQFHYDNPTKAVGQKDTTTKIRVYYKTTPGNVDCGMLVVGDLTLSMDNHNEFPGPFPYEIGPIPENTAFTHRQSTCPKECTQKLPNNINVFGGMLHMHYYGEKIHLDLYDSNDTLDSTVGRSDFWDNGHQYFDPNFAFTLSPGMSMQLHCSFNTRVHGKAVNFDTATSEEMCQAFMYYYPAENVEVGKGPLNVCGMEAVTGITGSVSTWCAPYSLGTPGLGDQVSRTGSFSDPKNFAGSVSGSAGDGDSCTCLKYGYSFATMASINHTFVAVAAFALVVIFN